MAKSDATTPEAYEMPRDQAIRLALLGAVLDRGVSPVMAVAAAFYVETGDLK